MRVIAVYRLGLRQPPRICHEIQVGPRFHEPRQYGPFHEAWNWTFWRSSVIGDESARAEAARRDEILVREIFYTLQEAMILIEDWRNL